MAQSEPYQVVVKFYESLSWFFGELRSRACQCMRIGLDASGDQPQRHARLIPLREASKKLFPWWLARFSAPIAALQQNQADRGVPAFAKISLGCDTIREDGVVVDIEADERVSAVATRCSKPIEDPVLEDYRGQKDDEECDEYIEPQWRKRRRYRRCRTTRYHILLVMLHLTMTATLGNCRNVGPARGSEANHGNKTKNASWCAEMCLPFNRIMQGIQIVV